MFFHLICIINFNIYCLKNARSEVLTNTFKFIVGSEWVLSDKIDLHDEVSGEAGLQDFDIKYLSQLAAGHGPSSSRLAAALSSDEASFNLSSGPPYGHDHIGSESLLSFSSMSIMGFI